ncbi:MAG: glycosyltransferase family 2 protein [Candidatus Loosdrechtia sp.]|uniref:glycosyltransferase family 2 protein n=1 Tax=Candidatus Loosdrechtia sp. TaxID=3101272 RepID=UPI003A5DC8AF|nr:MAG: glycosyltransferase family 2 protein [Candidatus Jettenia sp. AMX2]
MNKKEKIALSIAIITKNEEKRLPDCLTSVSFADDIVIVDSGSIDYTVKIAEDFGCRVFKENWKGYGPQINSAVAKCKNDWVLILDADERIPPETKEDIVKIIQNPSADAYSFPRRNYLHGRWIKHSDWWPDRVTRLARKSNGQLHGRTHGKWITKGDLKAVKNPIDHFSFSSYSDMLKKLDQYSTAASKELFRQGKRTNIFVPLCHGFGMFIKIYFFKKGFLDGFDGFIIALTKAAGSFFKYVKLLELQCGYTQVYSEKKLLKG